MRRRILNTMKRLEIVLERDQIDMVCGVICDHATGYTVIPDVRGFGHHGHHHDDMAVVVTVVTRDHVDPILDVLLPLLDRRSGVVLVSDVSVLRGEYFVPEIKDRLTAKR
ncbi:MAG: nitrogen regulatory protein [Candidatus Eremiobacteraeota bacterium]|nr:nitrogen regulatory protein [Candidatus Eremiobacteraeota bacterium]